jgi:hypothetical protein
MDGDAERTSTQNFLKFLTEAQNDRDMKGLDGSNLPLSAKQSWDYADSRARAAK